MWNPKLRRHEMEIRKGKQNKKCLAICNAVGEIDFWRWNEINFNGKWFLPHVTNQKEAELTVSLNVTALHRGKTKMAAPTNHAGWRQDWRGHENQGHKRNCRDVSTNNRRKLTNLEHTGTRFGKIHKERTNCAIKWSRMDKVERDNCTPCIALHKYWDQLNSLDSGGGGGRRCQVTTSTSPYFWRKIWDF